jgi:hypothetical protein
MNEPQKLRKKRAFAPGKARQARQQGHNDALLFAKLIGLGRNYDSDPKAKKDVVDPSLRTHSLKSGQKKWQIFLYRKSHFEREFRAMNGIGEILIDCIEAFPMSFDDYTNNKTEAKEKLRPSMVALANKLQDKHRLRAFISKSMFNGGEVDYLTVFDNDKFHVFWGEEVARVMTENLVVLNSQARQADQFPEQKVIFKYEKTTLGEIEVRRDSPSHYKEILFSVLKPKIMKLLYSKIIHKQNYNDTIIIYGEATKHFGRWKN